MTPRLLNPSLSDRYSISASARSRLCIPCMYCREPPWWLRACQASVADEGPFVAVSPALAQSGDRCELEDVEDSRSGLVCLCHPTGT
jgi:hypothetical protein